MTEAFLLLAFNTDICLPLPARLLVLWPVTHILAPLPSPHMRLMSGLTLTDCFVLSDQMPSDMFLCSI